MLKVGMRKCYLDALLTLCRPIQFRNGEEGSLRKFSDEEEEEDGVQALACTSAVTHILP